MKETIVLVDPCEEFGTCWIVVAIVVVTESFFVQLLQPDVSSGINGCVTFPLGVGVRAATVLCISAKIRYNNMRALVLLALAVLVTVVYGGALNGKLRKREAIRCYRVNEVYTDCGSSCPKTCASLLESAPPVFCPEMCVPGCFCTEGTVRNRWGNCISIDQCPCRGQDEVFSCGSEVQETCNTLKSASSNVGDNCVTACRCRAGFARDSSDTCIPIAKCAGNNL